jgi:hypothetical protein
VAASVECDLGIGDLVEVLAFALWKQLEFRLASRLHEKLVTFPLHAQDEIRRQFIASNIAIEQIGIDRDLLLLFWRLIQGSLARLDEADLTS